MQSNLITPVEAAALLMRPTRGRKVHYSTIVKWGKAGRFPMQWCNGWKVEREPFLAWARQTCRLPGFGRTALTSRHRRQQQHASTSYLKQALGI